MHIIEPVHSSLLLIQRTPLSQQLHGRSREQRYTKLADWQYVAECARAASPLPLFGNGDVLSWEEYEAKRSASGVAGVMMARGALIKPWIFTEIKERRTWDIRWVSRASSVG